MSSYVGEKMAMSYNTMNCLDGWIIVTTWCRMRK